MTFTMRANQIMPLLLAWIAWFLLLAAAPADAPAQEQDADNAASLDIYAFAQGDGGGNEFARESFEYIGARVALKMKINDEIDFRGRGTTALVNNPDPPTLPSTIVNAANTSASADLVTLDSSLTLDFRPEPAPGLTVSTGIYYHHQLNLIAGGGDFVISQEFFDGDTILSLSYTFRFDYIERDTWDGQYDGEDQRISHNIQFNWQQTLTDSLRSALGVQLTQMNGYLADHFAYVALFSGGDPVFLVDETLPRRRTRWQFNGRIRWSPGVGASIGLDGSWYTDDWGIDHIAIEPNGEIPFGDGDIRLRLWYRLSVQWRTKYFTRQPASPAPEFRTQDSDLASWTLHSAGALLAIVLQEADPSTSTFGWQVRFSALGFHRTDGVHAVGLSIGGMASW